MKLIARCTMLGLLILVVSELGVSQSMQRLFINNRPNSRFEITPATKVTAELKIPELPPGSFFLKNNTDKQITALVVIWTYVDSDGASQTHRLTCDGYLGFPSESIVQAHKSSLITLYGYSRAQSASEVPGWVGASSPHYSQDLIAMDGSSPIFLALDEIIFEDGEIVGPNDFHYDTEITLRFSAAQELLAALAAARDTQKDLKTLLGQVRENAIKAQDRKNHFKAQYASVLLGSPQLDESLRHLAAQSVPKRFYRSGE